MTEGNIEEKAITKSDQWRERIAEQERSGLSVKQFCQERGVTQYSFYAWRKRLRKKEPPVRFALVDRGAVWPEGLPEAGLELVLRSGERLRIGAGVDRVTLRVVLEALRA
jgi:Transposase